MIDLGTVTADDFEGWADEPFQLELSTGELLPLSVIAVDRRPQAGHPRPPFSVVFDGDLARPVAQNVHRLDHPATGTFEILLVPIQPRDGRARYEAVFG